MYFFIFASCEPLTLYLTVKKYCHIKLLLTINFLKPFILQIGNNFLTKLGDKTEPTTKMAAASPSKCIDRYMPIEGTSKSVHLQILQGDITTGDTEAVVVFRARDGTTTGDSLRVLQAAGQQKIDDEYRSVQIQGGQDVTRGVVRTGAGNLVKPKYILHLIMDDNIAKFRDTIATAFRVADRLTLRSIAFPYLSDSNFDSFEETMIESFEQFTTVDRPICINFVQLIISQGDTFTQYAWARQEMERYSARLQANQMLRGVPGAGESFQQSSSCRIC